MVLQFVDDDLGYREWIFAHPNGFVVNAPRSLAANSLILHRAACRSILPRAGKHWTKESVKVCSGGMKELEIWAMDNVGGATHLCPTCFP